MKKIKILICIVVSSLVLLGVVLVSTKCMINKASTKVVNDVPVEPVLDEKGEILGSNEIHPLPKQMLFSTPSAQSDAIIVSASFTPADANIIKLNWNIAFQNAESEWAKGKNVSEYIAIEANNTTCSVSCLQEFGEPIQLICSSRYNPEIKASCRLDYGRRIITRDLAFDSANYYEYNEEKNAYYINFTTEIDTLEFSKTSEENSTFGVGTATLDVVENYYIKTEQSILDLFNRYGQEITMPGACAAKTTAVSCLSMDAVDLTTLMGAESSHQEGEDFLIYDLMPDYIYNNPDGTLFWVVLEISYNSVVINTFEYPIRVKEWNFGKYIEGITLNQDYICF